LSSIPIRTGLRSSPYLECVAPFMGARSEPAFPSILRHTACGIIFTGARISFSGCLPPGQGGAQRTPAENMAASRICIVGAASGLPSFSVSVRHICLCPTLVPSPYGINASSYLVRFLFWGRSPDSLEAVFFQKKAKRECVNFSIADPLPA